MRNYLIYAAAVVVATLGVINHARVDAQTQWNQEPRESLALAGIQGLYRDVDEQVAPVISDARTRRALIEFVIQRGQAISRAQEDLFADAQRRCGVAVVPSGATWVRRT